MHIGLISRVLIGIAAVLQASQGIAQAQFATGAPPGSPGHEIIHLKGDLYRFRQIRHYGMFLYTPEGIILVDPTNTEAAKWLKAEFARRFNVPVKYVIYSHAHNDHASGGEVFADTATFVAHENMARNLDRLGGLVHSQRVLLALTQAGMSREDAYSVVQTHAMSAWREGGSFLDRLAADPKVTALLKRGALEKLFDLGYHTKYVDTIFRRVFGRKR